MRAPTLNFVFSRPPPTTSAMNSWPRRFRDRIVRLLDDGIGNGVAAHVVLPR